MRLCESAAGGRTIANGALRKGDRYRGQRTSAPIHGPGSNPDRRNVADVVDALSNPDVIAQLWNDFVDTEGLERHVVEVDDLGPEPVTHILTSRWRAAALRI